MFLRGILLTNFHEILKEVSLVCGARTASSLLYYLYSPTSLRQQFKQTGQLDYGLASYYRDLNQPIEKSMSNLTPDGPNEEEEKLNLSLVRGSNNPNLNSSRSMSY